MRESSANFNQILFDVLSGMIRILSKQDKEDFGAISVSIPVLLIIFLL
jgi:hypothetical protein